MIFTQASPDFPIILVEFEYSLKELDRSREVLFGPEDT